MRAGANTAAARAAAERALERDQNSLETLQLLAEIAVQHTDLDTAVHSLHRWLDVSESRTRKPTRE